MMSGGTDFERFHAQVLPEAIAAHDGGRAASADVGDSRALAFRLVDANGDAIAAYTYRSRGGGIGRDATCDRDLRSHPR